MDELEANAALATCRMKYALEVIRRPYPDPRRNLVPEALAVAYPFLRFSFVTDHDGRGHWFFESDDAVQCFDRWADDQERGRRPGWRPRLLPGHVPLD